jgi:hypothetical protein
VSDNGWHRKALKIEKISCKKLAGVCLFFAKQWGYCQQTAHYNAGSAGNGCGLSGCGGGGGGGGSCGGGCWRKKRAALANLLNKYRDITAA